MRARSARRVTVVANELRGAYPAGGMGTATTFLALALARMGHSVEILFAWQPSRSIDPYWTSVYAEAGVDIRRVSDTHERVEPAHFRVMRNVELALREDPPDVVIVHDLSAPAYSALRLRQLGLGFENVLFVVFCHGTRRWIMEMSGKLGARDARDLLAESVLEQASVELADVVVSPSAYLIGWMRDAGWQLPEETVVIPYFTRSGATGEPSSASAKTGDSNGVKRLAFFGRLEDKKGVRPFVAGLNRLEPRLLRGVELEFIGKTTTSWTADRIEALFPAETRRSLLRLSFETDLDQHEALDHLSRPGTLAVMPSLGDNSPNTVYECLEQGIPFIASEIGGIPELIAPEDRARVLFQPTPEGVAEVLRRVLSNKHQLRPARPAFDGGESSAAWAKVLETRAAQPKATSDAPVDVIVVRRNSRTTPARFRAALERQSYADFSVIECEGPSVEQARASGLRAGTAPYVIFLDEDDLPEDELLTVLVRAQTASDADVVTCAVRLVDERPESTLRFFSGEPRGLGALSNDYGTVALFRRGVLDDVSIPRPAEADPDWPLFAGLAASGAQIVSVPTPLVTRSTRPGAVEQSPSDALLVLERLEQAAPDQVRLVGRLAAGLAALPGSATRSRPRRAQRLQRILRGAWRRWGS